MREVYKGTQEVHIVHGSFTGLKYKGLLRFSTFPLFLLRYLTSTMCTSLEI